MHHLSTPEVSPVPVRLWQGPTESSSSRKTKSGSRKKREGARRDESPLQMRRHRLSTRTAAPAPQEVPRCAPLRSRGATSSQQCYRSPLCPFTPLRSRVPCAVCADLMVACGAGSGRSSSHLEVYYRPSREAHETHQANHHQHTHQTPRPEPSLLAARLGLQSQQSTQFREQATRLGTFGVVS